MLGLRPYKPSDAQTILSWCSDAVSFRKWTADRYPAYPISPDDLNRKYLQENGDCAEPDNFYPMTAFDENGIVGHLIIRYTAAQPKECRLGFIIVNDALRGKGYGKTMVRLAVRYCFDYLLAQRVTLGVFENNPAALHCYQAAGFREVPNADQYCEIDGETWRCLELEIR